MTEEVRPPQHYISAFAIAVMTITSLDSMRNLPAIAMFGTPLIVFFLIGVFTFLIPCAMVSAELSTGWQRMGGVYVWVREAFGKKYGFLAIWFQWIENIIWYPTILSFIASTFGYLISPELANNKFYLITIIISTFWAVSFINLLGIKMSAHFGAICGVIGLIIPMTLMIILSLTWLIMGHPLQIPMTMDALIPNLHQSGLIVTLIAVILCFCGMEMTAVHAQNVKEPARDYPRAMLASFCFIGIAMLLGALAIAYAIPSSQLSLVGGIMQTFSFYLNEFHLGFLKDIIALCIITGSLGTLSDWVIAPNRGLVMALQDLHMGSRLRKPNRAGIPSGLLITQAIIVTIISLVFLLTPSVNGSYWILTAMAAQLYMGMYILMFAAAIALRYKHAKVHRAYRVPGKTNLGMWVVAGVGFITSILAVFIGFYPPDGVNFGGVVQYELTMFFGLFVMSAPPFWIYRRHRLREQAMDILESPTQN